MWSRTTPTGKIIYCERYKDPLTGKKKDVSVTFDKDTARNRKEASRMLQEKIAKRQEPYSKDITFGCLYDEYLLDLKKNVKLSTYKRNEQALGQIVKIIGRDVLVSKLSARFITNKFVDSGKKNKTLNEYMKRLGTMLRWGYTNDLVQDIGFLAKMKPFADDEKKDVSEKYMEQDELQLLISKLTHPIWKEVILFGALTGMRIGEIFALEKSDIDLDARLISITKNYDHNNQVVTTTKTLASNDTISIQDELVPVIKRINAIMAAQQIRHGYRSELFLSGKSGEHLSYAALEKYFRENTERILGRKLTFHSLRHTHASILFQMGKSVSFVQRRLRHGNNSKVTQEVYIHVTQKLKEKDAEEMKNICIL